MIKMNTLKKLFTLLIAFVIIFSANAQVLDEGFEGGALPPGWGNLYILETQDWQYQDGGVSGNPSSAHTGSFNAILFGTSTDYITTLMTPALDLSAGGYQLKFWQTQDAWGSDQDELEVYIKEGIGGSWVLLEQYTTPINDWTEETFVLSTTHSEVYIGFCAYTYWGYGVCLDDVLVELAPTDPIFAVDPESHDYGTYVLYSPYVSQDFEVSNAGAGTLTIASADDVVITGAGAYMFTIYTSETYPINLAAAETATYSVTFSPTVAGTYTVSFDITDNVTKAVNSIPLTGICEDPTLTPPFTEDFEPTYPDDYWIEFKGVLADPTITTGDFSSWADDGFGNDGEDGSAKLNIWGTNPKEWMATPPIDLGTGTDYQLEFDLALTEWGNTNASTLGDDDIFAVIISVDNGATWSSVNVLQQWGSTDVISATGDHIIIPLTGYSGIVRIGFYGESTVTNADNDLFVDNVSVFEAPSTETDITAFSFPEQTGAATIDATAHTVEIEVAYGTDLTDLIPTIEVSEGATIDPLSGVAQDFSSDVTYTVTAEDGLTIQAWIVTVTEAPSTETDITAFSFAEQTGAATIDATAHTVEIEVVNGTDLTDLIPTIEVSEGATIDPLSGVAQDFSSDVTYTVTAEDGETTQVWTVTVTEASSVNDIGAYGISIYPNPSNGVFNVNVTETFNLEVIDITGKIVKTQVLDNNTNTVNIAKQGVYILKLSNNNTSVTHRIIVD